jgi:hypothetical protein
MADRTHSGGIHGLRATRERATRWRIHCVRATSCRGTRFKGYMVNEHIIGGLHGIRAIFYVE